MKITVKTHISMGCILTLLLLSHYINCKSEKLSNKEKISSFLRNKQFDRSGDLRTDFTSVDLDNISIEMIESKSINLENNSVSFEPNILKLVYTPLKKYNLIKMNEILIFDNFEVLFDMNLLTKNIFGDQDREIYHKVQSALLKLKTRYGQISENCKFVFTKKFGNIINIPSSSGTIFPIKNLNYSIGLILNIFCFITQDEAITFHSIFSKMYNGFVVLMDSKFLLYFNKQKINNLKMILQKMNLNNYSQLSTPTIMINDSVNPNPYSYLVFTNNGVVFTDTSVNINNVLYSFSFDNIKNCIIEVSQNKIVLPNTTIIPDNFQSCIKFYLVGKDDFDTKIKLCSNRHSEYKCNLEIKFVQEMLGSKCSNSVAINIGYAFDNDNFNIKQYVMSLGSFSKEYVYHKIYEYIVTKLQLTKLWPRENQILIETKLTRIIQDLGIEFQNYLREHQFKIGLSSLIVESNQVPVIGTTPSFPVLSNAPLPQLPPQLINSIFTNNPVLKTNIFKLCENHPKMNECICAAFPLSNICSKEFCVTHQHFYECSPAYCFSQPNDIDACKCKLKPYDIECKCRLNPLRKECFCIKYPNSSFCLPDFCRKIENNHHIYCICNKNPYAPECKPAYCHDNKFDNRCKCLLHPEHKSCKCLINSSEVECSSNNSENINISSGKDENKLKNKPNEKKLISFLDSNNNIVKNHDQECHKKDIFCLCKNHPKYIQCVCLAFPNAQICKDSFCDKNKSSYECNPKNNCLADNQEDKCKCKHNFDNDCNCKLEPYSINCFCQIYKNSQLCDEKNCTLESDSLFCKCKESKKNPECKASFCGSNPNSPQCICIVRPKWKHCKCLNDPQKCSKYDIIKATKEYKKSLETTIINPQKNNDYNEEEDLGNLNFDQQEGIKLNTLNSNDVINKEEYIHDNGESKANINYRNNDQEDSLTGYSHNDNAENKREENNDQNYKSNNINFLTIKSNKSINSDQDRNYIMQLYNKQLLFNKRMKKIEFNLKTLEN